MKTMQAVLAVCGMMMAAAWHAGADEPAKAVVSTEVPGVLNASKTSDGSVYFGGQPTTESFDALKQQGVKVVINLRRADEMTKVNFDEKAAVEAAGMKYIQVPMESSALPSADALKPILEKLGAADDEHVFLHCASSNRVGGIWAVFEGINGKKPTDDAIADGKKAGLKSVELEQSVRTHLSETDAHEH